MCIFRSTRKLSCIYAEFHPRNIHFSNEPASLGGILTSLKSACLLPDRGPLQFRQTEGRTLFTDLPADCPDDIANRAIIELEFEGEIERCVFGSTPALRGGKES